MTDRERRDEIRRKVAHALSPDSLVLADFWTLLDQADALEAERDSLAAKITAVEAERDALREAVNAIIRQDYGDKTTFITSLAAALSAGSGDTKEEQ